MSIDIDALARLAEAATPGPWTVGFWPLPQPTHYVGAIDTANPISSKLRAHVTGHIPIEPDARFIAACDPATVAALVRAVRAALALEAAFADDTEEWPAPEYVQLVQTLAPFTTAGRASDGP